MTSAAIAVRGLIPPKLPTIKYDGAALAIYALAAVVLLTTTLAGPLLVGHDIHLEYYYAAQAVGGWDASLPHANNASLVITVLAPLISLLFGTHLMYVFAFLYPLLFAFVPVIVYRTARHVMPRHWAIGGALFFIATPVFHMELTAAVRWQMGELVLAGMLWAFVVLRSRWRYPALATLAVAAIFVYYSVALWLLGLLGFAVVSALLHRRWREALATAAVVVLMLGVGTAYYMNVSSGWVAAHLTNVVLNRSVDEGAQQVGITSTGQATRNALEATADESGGLLTGLMSGPRGPVFEAATGLDFMRVDALSKAFRVLQITAQALLVLGTLYLLRRRRLPWHYKTILVYACLVMVAVLVVPRLGWALGLSRAYVLALVSLAPAAAIGAAVVTRWRWPVALAAVAVYMAFTSGLVFNLADYRNIETYTVPYNVGLENARLDTGNYLTRNDDAVARWFDRQTALRPVYGDLGGTVILQHYLSMWESLPIPRSGWVEPLEPGTYYLLLREWNSQQGTMAFWRGPGLREQAMLPASEHATVEVLFQSGDAYALRVVVGSLP